MSDDTHWTPGAPLPAFQSPDQSAAPTWGGTAAAAPPPAAAQSPYGPPPPAAAQSPYAPQQPYAPQSYPQPPYGQLPYAPPAGYAPPYSPYGLVPQSTKTDGFAIAALVCGIVGATLFAVIFGAMGLSRIKRSGDKGRGMAIAGIVVGSAWLVLGILAAIAIPVFLNQRTDALHADCAAGDMAACDTLYDRAPAGSAEEEFGDTCGGRTDGGTLCTGLDAETYGDNADLDALWDSCDSGDAGACDQLYQLSSPGTDYEWFGATCGNRTDGQEMCVEAMAGAEDA